MNNQQHEREEGERSVGMTREKMNLCDSCWFFGPKLEAIAAFAASDALADHDKRLQREKGGKEGRIIVVIINIKRERESRVTCS